MRAPSTAWKEDVAPDEEARFARYAEQFTALQASRDAKHGAGRALHRKQLLAARARFEVLGGLPAHAAHGLFAAPAVFDSLVRLSNGSTTKARDGAPDVRGFAFKVLGVTGESALGGPAKSQDFSLINREAFSSPKSDAFVGIALAAAKGPFALVQHLVSAHGLFAGLKVFKGLVDSLGRPFHGFANERFYSAAPIAVGPYAAKVRLLPSSTTRNPDASEDWGRDLKRRLKDHALTHEVQLQFFVDEETTPIEDASRVWPEAEAPFVTVAKLTLVQQDLDGPEGAKLAEEAEAGVVDPWSCLAAHRPLGEVMRARKTVYYASQQRRAARR